MEGPWLSVIVLLLGLPVDLRFLCMSSFRGVRWSRTGRLDLSFQE